ncbi:hypothetical protein B5X24_HaOG209368 [Helicoverpa armigera]|nr:hypothetical protein B5X24_HaOG209368 [Helicoverpa armigera]
MSEEQQAKVQTDINYDVSAVSVQSRLLPFWREIPRAWFIQFEAVIDPLKTSDDQKFRYLLQQLQTVDLQHLTDILYNPPATGKYEKVKQRLLEAYDKSDVKNFQKLISGLELGDQKPSQLLRKMRELASGMITEEGLKIEWLNHLPAQVRVVLSVNKESSLDTLAAMADKMVEYAESPSVAAVTAPASSSSSTGPMTQLQKLWRSRWRNLRWRSPSYVEAGHRTDTVAVHTIHDLGPVHGRCLRNVEQHRNRETPTGSADTTTASGTRQNAVNHHAAEGRSRRKTKVDTDRGGRRCPVPQDFLWSFIVADVKTSILGADFLRHFKLLVDLDKKKLVDKVTLLAIDALEVSTSTESVHIVSSNQLYYDILKQYPDVLRPMSLKQPPKHDVVHHIETTGPPLYARPRPLPPDKYKAAKEEFDRMLEMGICKPSKSPWASPLHVVKKKDGKLRVCGDYRRLNSVTQPDRYPIPRIQDFTYQLHNKNIFSKLDLKMAYYWIPIAKDDAQKTAITTPFGLFEFNCMTFGLRNGSQTFQRFMHEVLRGISGCFCFIDDILLCEENETKHKLLLHQVLQRLDKYGLTLNIEKCEFGKETIDFLGYEVSATGIKPTAERVKAISTYPKPTTVLQLRRFLGMINFYRDCLPRQAELQSELNKYLHNKKRNDNTPIEWTTEAEQAFEKCRRSITEATILSHPVHGSALAIMTDASDYSLGAVLQQKVNKVWKPLAFYSKAMSETQRRYSVYDRELLAMYTAVKHFRRLIEGCDVEIYTDHKPLTYALTKKASSSDTPRRERQLHFISQFCSSIKYIEGEQNTVADALSRLEEINCPTSIDYNQLSIDQQQDQELKLLKKQSNLIFKEVSVPGCNRPITCEFSTSIPRPYLPERHRYAAFKAVHELCHPGVRSTRQLMARKLFWPSMNKEVARWTRACINCQRAKIHRHVITPLVPFPPSKRFEHIHIDIVGPLRLSNEYRYCVTIIDRCTKWPEAIPVRDITADVIAQVLYETWIVRFGCPLRITTDQGRQFESALFNALMKRMGINRIRTTAYHPQSNGQVERWHRTMKAALMARGATTTWTEELPTVLLGLRTALRQDNNLSPALMTYGTTLRIPSDFLEPQSASINDAELDLSTCTHVFVRNDATRAPLTPPYDGPYEVLKRDGKYYKIQLPLRTAVVALDRLKPAYVVSETETVSM